MQEKNGEIKKTCYMNQKKHLNEMKVEISLKASVIPRWGSNQELTHIKRETGILWLVISKC